MPRLIGVLLALAAMAGCGPVITRTRIELPADVMPPQGRYVEMQYLGNGGWVFKRGDDAIATAPFVTNPAFLGVYVPRTADVERIEKRIPAMPELPIMLLGHSHYDHAMDLPEILRDRAPKARLYGSVTAGHLFANTTVSSRLEVIDEGEAADGDRPGRWFPRDDAPVRFMALTSNHAPHLCGRKLVSSEKLTKDSSHLPSVPACWPEGETLAYLIDFLRPDGSVEFRIYYQDAAADPKRGGIPKNLPPSQQATVDVAILCVAGFAEVDDSPGWIVRNTMARTIVGGHWEDFFLFPSDERPRVAPGTSLEDFITEAQKVLRAPVQIPALGEKLYFPLDS